MIRDGLMPWVRGRVAVVDGVLTGVFSGQRVPLIGPPGSAKSMLADARCRRPDGAVGSQLMMRRASCS